VSRKIDPIALDGGELVDVLQPYGIALGDYLGSLSVEQRQAFRSLRGNQGKATARRKCEQALHEKFPDFLPAGLEDFLKLEAAQTNERGYAAIQRIETALQRLVIDTLKAEFSDDRGEAWWYSGVPEQIRKKAVERLEEAQGKGKREGYLDLIDFRSIVIKNWDLFGNLLAFGKSGNKEARTLWIARVNEMRKVVMHPAKQQILTWGDLADLDHYDKWIQERGNEGDSGEDED
jgi:hypothetical protein